MTKTKVRTHHSIRANVNPSTEWRHIWHSMQAEEAHVFRDVRANVKPGPYPLVSHVPLSVTLDPGAGRPWLDCMPTVLHRNALAPATRVEAL